MHAQPATRTPATAAALLLALLLLCPAAGGAQGAGAVTVEDYCLMTQSLMELSVGEWEERAERASASKGDRRKLAASLEEVTKRYRPLRAEVYARYRMTPAEELRYASDHRQEIADYLDERPELRDSLDALKARIDALVEQVEAAAPPPTEGGQQ